MPAVVSNYVTVREIVPVTVRDDMVMPVYGVATLTRMPHRRLGGVVSTVRTGDSDVNLVVIRVTTKIAAKISEDAVLATGSVFSRVVKAITVGGVATVTV